MGAHGLGLEIPPQPALAGQVIIERIAAFPPDADAMGRAAR